MRILGLTGSIGMGKSTAAGMLRRMGVPVFDADGEVARLLGPGSPVVARIAERHPDVVTPDGAADRQALGRRVFADPAELAWLESELHPRVRAAQRRFLAIRQRHGFRLAVLDIPLLFETGAERRVDAVLVVSCPAFLQRRRVLARPGMTAAQFQAILRRQVPDREKRRRADHAIPTGLGRAVTWRRLVRCLATERAKPGRAWRPRGYRPGDR